MLKTIKINVILALPLVDLTTEGLSRLLAWLTDYTRELFREAIPYSEINRMAEIVFLPRWQKLFVAAKRWKMATGNQVPW